jgi:hypothetical protein
MVLVQVLPFSISALPESNLSRAFLISKNRHLPYKKPLFFNKLWYIYWYAKGKISSRVVKSRWKEPLHYNL